MQYNVSGMHDYTDVTELPGSRLSTEQLARLRQRYMFARQLAQGKRVLEVSCGAGLGLGLLAQRARQVFAGDFTFSVLSIAQEQPEAAASLICPLICFDAQHLPITPASVDLIVNFEAIYYYASPAQFLAECRRVLTPAGTLLIGSDNPQWPFFAPGPLSKRYLTLAEYHQIVREAGFCDVRCFAGFGEASSSTLHNLRGSIRRWITATGVFRLLPVLREWLKPLVYRNLVAVDSRLLSKMGDVEMGNGEMSDVEMSDTEKVVPVDHTADVRQFRVIYVLATQPQGIAS